MQSTEWYHNGHRYLNFLFRADKQTDRPMEKNISSYQEAMKCEKRTTIRERKSMKIPLISPGEDVEKKEDVNIFKKITFSVTYAFLSMTDALKMQQ